MGAVMSRHKGRRERPAPERREFKERYSRRKTPRQGRVDRLGITQRPQWEAEITPGRRWSAVFGGTIVAIFSFGLIAAAIVRAEEGARDEAVMLSIGAAAAVPILLLVVGFISRHASPWYTSAIGSPLMVLAFLVVSPLAGDPATGFAFALGVGGALALRMTDGVHTRASRLVVAVGLAVYTKIVFLISPAIAIIAAPLLPLAGIAVIDRIRERRAAEQPGGA
jgi:hypothetical protein